MRNSRTVSVSPAVVVVTAAAQRGGELGVQRHHAHRALLHHLRRARAALGRAARVRLPAQHLLAVRGAAAAPLARPQILETFIDQYKTYFLTERYLDLRRMIESYDVIDTDIPHAEQTETVQPLHFPWNDFRVGRTRVICKPTLYHSMAMLPWF